MSELVKAAFFVEHLHRRISIGFVQAYLLNSKHIKPQCYTLSGIEKLCAIDKIKMQLPKFKSMDISTDINGNTTHLSCRNTNVFSYLWYLKWMDSMLKCEDFKILE